MLIDELKNSKIHTAVSIDVVNEYLPESTNVVFYDSVEGAIKNSLNELVFLSWDDYVEDLELVIPVDI